VQKNILLKLWSCRFGANMLHKRPLIRAALCYCDLSICSPIRQIVFLFISIGAPRPVLEFGWINFRPRIATRIQIHSVQGTDISGGSVSHLPA
jgi:hypothetical protein